ncbi:MAG: hypothetical protein K9H58_18015 [Bacteroidales bacterium]|nr:hypothetical protein [Bacteroidales bacterium]
MKKYKLYEESIDVVELLLLKLSSFFASNQQMPKSQFRITAEAIIEEFYYFSVCDLQLAFKKIRKEKLYGQLSPNFIINKLEEYQEERYTVAENLSISKHQTQLGECGDNDFIKKFYEFRKTNPTNKDTKDMARDDIEAFQKFRSEYERTKINLIQIDNNPKESKIKNKTI